MAMNLPVASVGSVVWSCFNLQSSLIPWNYAPSQAQVIDFRRSRAMARAFREIFLGFILLSSAGTGTPAGPIEDATAAVERRDLATALQLLRPLAERGNADAQMKLGFLYVAGGGIPQDYAAAVKWFHLAADQGQA